MSIGEENATKNKIPAKYYAKHRIMHFLDHTIFDEINGMWGGTVSSALKKRRNIPLRLLKTSLRRC